MDNKKPQQAQQQTDVVSGAALHGMQRITQRTLERIAIQPSVALHMSDGWLDGAAPFDHRLQRARHASLLARHALDLSTLVALHRAWPLVGQDTHLLDGILQRVLVVRIAWHGAYANHQAFFDRGGQRDLYAKLVGVACLAFSDALDFRCVQGIQVVLVFCLLREDAADLLQQILALGLHLCPPTTWVSYTNTDGHPEQGRQSDSTRW